MTRPDHYQAILGLTFVTRSSETILKLGKYHFDRFQLGEIGIPQLKAARSLHLTLQRLSIKSPTELASRIGELATIKGLGTTAYYAALALLQHTEAIDKGLNTYKKAATRGDRQVTFNTLHKRRKGKDS
jgi:hypothetical protein